MKTIACIGDSLTEGADVEKGFRWTSLAANALAADVRNCGIGGDTTQGMLARFYPQVLGWKPEYVIITGGTNDLWWGAQIQVVLSNIFSIVCQARYNQVTPVIGLPLPMHLPAVQKQDYSPPPEGYDHMAEQLTRLVEALSASAAGSELPVIDFHRAFMLDGGESDAGLFLEDGLHPSREGHRKMAALVIEQMRGDFLF